jgi:hypothetical protein
VRSGAPFERVGYLVFVERAAYVNREVLVAFLGNGRSQWRH